MANTILVGIDPGYGGGSALPVDSPSGKRIATLLGDFRGGYMAAFDRVNLYPMKNAQDYDQEYGQNLLGVLRGRRVVALGRRVADALGIDGDWFEWSSCDGFVGSSMPHPSGLSRWWNDPDNSEAARRFVRRSVMSCVHVEGPDGSGKTTLCHELVRRTSYELVPTDGPPSSWDECKDRIRRRVSPGVVCDRSSGLVSELVYGPVIRGKMVVGERTVWDAVRSVLGSITFVYCRPPIEAMIHKPRDGEDPNHVRSVDDRHSLLVEQYDAVMAKICRLGGRVVRYDRTTTSPEEVVQCVV